MAKRLVPLFVLPVLAVGLGLGALGCGGGGDGGTTPAPLGPFASPPNDPLFPQQWHLENTGQGGGTMGEDARVRAAWEGHTVTGAGIRITVIDDGVQIAHPDLAQNVEANAHLDNADMDGDPTPDLVQNAGTGGANAHGTACAGVACAAGHNGIGVTGAAPRARLAGVRNPNTATAAQVAAAMTLNAAANHVYSMSYGPADWGQVAPTTTEEWNAVDMGLMTGRGGLGAIYSRAAGNGGEGGNTGPDGTPANTNTPVDYSTIDELGGHRGVISVGAMGADGIRPNYGERGANLLVCAPTQGNANPAITTTDLAGSPAGYEAPAGDYTNTFNGTSAACPLVSGVVALVLEARPQLTWRDLREVIARSARKNDLPTGQWFNNGAVPPIMVSHNYGFGCIDANAAVALAKTWTLLPADQPPVASAPIVPGVTVVPDGGMVQSTHMFAATGRTIVEHVLVTLNVSSDRFRDLTVTLQSPAGTTVNLSEPAVATPFDTSFVGTIRLGATLFLGEPVDGTWTLTVTDTNNAPATNHTVNSWMITVWAR